MASRLGNYSVSGLMRSANSNSNALWALQDKQAAQSFKDQMGAGNDQAVYDTYNAYLKGSIERAKGMNDIAGASKIISYQNTGISANQTFNTSQIREASIKVLEGAGSLQDKAATLNNLANQAQQNGDAATYQGLRQQWDTLQQTIQTHQQADAKTALENNVKMADAKIANTRDYIDALKSGNPDHTFGVGGTPTLKDIRDTLAAEGQNAFGGKGVAGAMLAAQNTIQLIVGALHQSISEATTPSQQHSLNSELNGILTGTTKFDIYPAGSNALGDANTPNRGFSLQDVTQNIADAQSGISLSRFAVGQDGYTIKTPYVSGYRRILDAQGNAHIVPITGANPSSANPDNAKAYSAAENQLKSEGYNVSINHSTGQLSVTGQDGTEHQFVLDQNGQFVSLSKTANPDGTPNENFTQLDVKGLNGATSSGIHDLNQGDTNAAFTKGGNDGLPIKTFTSAELKPEFGTNVADFQNGLAQRQIIAKNLGALNGVDSGSALSKSAADLLNSGQFGLGLQGGDNIGNMLQTGNFAARLQAATTSAVQLQNTIRAQTLQNAATTAQFNLNQTPITNPNYHLPVRSPLQVAAQQPNISVQPVRTQPTLSVQGGGGGQPMSGGGLQGGGNGLQGNNFSLQGSGSSLQGSLSVQ